MQDKVVGGMTSVLFDSPPAPQATQVVLVGGTLLPMPQPDLLEDLPSPTATPESATLMRMAKALSRQQAQQASGALAVGSCCTAASRCF